MVAMGLIVVATGIAIGPSRGVVLAVAGAVVAIGVVAVGLVVDAATRHATDSIEDGLTARVARLTTNNLLDRFDGLTVPVLLLGLIATVVGVSIAVATHIGGPRAAPPPPTVPAPAGPPRY
jgi:hypothetical protein